MAIFDGTTLLEVGVGSRKRQLIIDSCEAKSASIVESEWVGALSPFVSFGLDVLRLWDAL